MRNLTIWTKEEEELLKQNFQLKWAEIIKLFPNRTRSSIQGKLFTLNLKRDPKNNCKNWTNEQLKFLHENYGKITNEEFEKTLNKKWHTIEEFARRRGFVLSDFKDKYGKTINNVNKPTLLPLLEENLQAYYWVGYLMADGYMHDGLGQIILVSVEKDADHLKKYADFLRTSIKIYKGSKTGFKSENNVVNNQVRVSVADILNCRKVKDKFDWKIQKTYYPPSIDKLNNVLAEPDKFLAYFIGFCDGDGSINKDQGLRLENHASWNKVHNFFLDKLRECSLLQVDKKSKINCNGYSDFCLGKQVNQQLKKFIIENNLVVLERKWNKINI
jgi:hypothetical protein